MAKCLDLAGPTEETVITLLLTDADEEGVVGLIFIELAIDLRETASRSTSKLKFCEDFFDEEVDDEETPKCGGFKSISISISGIPFIDVESLDELEDVVFADNEGVFGFGLIDEDTEGFFFLNVINFPIALNPNLFFFFSRTDGFGVVEDVDEEDDDDLRDVTFEDVLLNS